jgi:hypothetical protein
MRHASHARTIVARREPDPAGLKEATMMLHHPDTVVQFALLRHHELQTEGAQIRRTAEANPAPNSRLISLTTIRSRLGSALIDAGTRLLANAGSMDLANPCGELNRLHSS